MWDATEFVLKASFSSAEDEMLGTWINGYLQAMQCFPRLHVIAATDMLRKARHAFARVPNVSLHSNNFPPIFRVRPDQERTLGLASYAYKQWPLMWLDNITSARHVLAWDVDSVPVLPLRCRHVFDAAARPYWFSITRSYAAASKHGGLASWTAGARARSIRPCASGMPPAAHRKHNPPDPVWDGCLVAINL